MKGSTYGRRTITDKSGVIVDRTIALKDLDFIEKQDRIKVGQGNRDRILEIIKKDSAFFRDNNIIDYSILIGVTNRSEHPNEPVFEGNDHGAALSHRNDTN